MDLLSLDSNPRHTAIHMLFNSSGGMIVDALNMCGYIEGYPPDIPVTMFNICGVQSAAVLVFLSAAHRVVSPYAKFLLHPCNMGSDSGAEQRTTSDHIKTWRFEMVLRNDKDITAF